MTSDRAFPRRFHDRVGDGFPTSRDLLRIFATGGFSAAPPTAVDAARVPRVADDARIPDAGTATAVTWIGHATHLIHVAGRTFLVDPVWSDRIPGGVRRHTPPGLRWDALPPLDGVLVSHNHYDHLDAPTLKRLPRDVPVFAPARLGAWFRGRGFRDVTELDWWESVDRDGVTLAAVPAQHWSRRTPFDLNATLWCGWVVKPASAEAGGVWYSGDTGYNASYFSEIGVRHPRVDVAVLPVGAYAPRWFMRYAHQTPEEAVQAARDAGARHMVPVHWGAFVLSREAFTEPVERTRAAWADARLPRDALWDLALGETRTVATRQAAGDPPSRA